MTSKEKRRKAAELRDGANTLLLAEEVSVEDTEKAEGLIAESEKLESQAELIDKLDTEKRVKNDRFTEDYNRPLITGHEALEDKPWEENQYGEFLLAVQRFTTNTFRDPRLESALAIQGASESVPSDGGFLVPAEISDRFLVRIYDNSQVASRCTRTTLTTGNRLVVNGIDETSRATGSRSGAVVSYWEGEGAAGTASKPKFRQLEIPLKKNFALYYATEELMEDAPAFGQRAQAAFAEEHAFQVQDGIIEGDGAVRMNGIKNAPALVTVAKRSGQVAGTFLYENVVDMYARHILGPQSAWFINQDVLPQLLTLNLAVGTGGAPVWMPPGGASVSPFSTLIGLPVIPIEQCETLGTEGDVYLANFAGYELVDKGGVKQQSSIHVQFLTEQTVFRSTLRINGTPARTAALTPFKGSNTISEFTAIAVRA